MMVLCRDRMLESKVSNGSIDVGRIVSIFALVDNVSCLCTELSHLEGFV
jgi:hypothetical protein